MNEKFDDNNDVENIKIEENNTDNLNWNEYNKQFRSFGLGNNFSKMKNKAKEIYIQTNPFLRPIVILLGIPIAIFASLILWGFAIVAASIFAIISIFGFLLFLLGWFSFIVFGGIYAFFYSIYQLLTGDYKKYNRSEENKTDEN